VTRKVKAYILARLSGSGVRESARKAGYSCGVPSSKAVFVESVFDSIPPAEKSRMTDPKERDRIRRVIDRRRAEIDHLTTKLELAELGVFEEHAQ